MYLEWKDTLKRNPLLVRRFREEYNKLKTIQEEAGNNPESELWALRLYWEDVFTTQCAATSTTGGVRTPCGMCKACDIRCAQAILVVFAAQGVADANILAHLGATFRLPRYMHFGCLEWAMVGPHEIASVLTPCSCHGLKGNFLADWFGYVGQNGIPQTVEQCLCLYGMRKKSACLFLSAFLGKPVGVPVDRHLQAAFKNLKWVHPECTNATAMSHMIELWLPMEDTADINNVVAGLRQMFQKRQHRPVLLNVAAACGRKQIALLKTLTQDIKRPKGDNDQPE
jgi:hypothetical protein